MKARYCTVVFLGKTLGQLEGKFRIVRAEKNKTQSCFVFSMKQF